MTQCLTTSIYVHLLMMNDTFSMLAIIQITHYVRKLLHCFESWWSPWTWWGGVIFFTWRSYKLTFVRSFVTSFSMDRPISFSWFLAQWCKMVMPKMWRSPISGKNSFPVENARKKNSWKMGLGHVLNIPNTHLCAKKSGKTNDENSVFPAYFWHFWPEKYGFLKSGSFTF